MSAVPTRPIILPIELLAKAIIRFGAFGGVEAVHAAAIRHNDHSIYVIRVLEASADIRAAVRTAAIANAAADPDAYGQKRLVCILTMFEALDSQQKANFITAFKACAVIVGHGAIETVNGNTYQPGHIPPRNPP